MPELPTDRTPTPQDIIERALNHLIPGAAPASLRAEISEGGPFGINSWSGDIPGLAELLAAALHEHTGTKPTPADGALLRWAAARLRAENGQHGSARYDYETGPGMGHAAARLDEWADEIHPGTTTPRTTAGN